MRLSFPDVCKACGVQFAEHEQRVGLLLAGRDLASAQHEVHDGDELFRTVAYHTACAPDQ